MVDRLNRKNCDKGCGIEVSQHFDAIAGIGNMAVAIYAGNHLSILDMHSECDWHP